MPPALTLVFRDRQTGEPNFRDFCVQKLGRGDQSPFANLHAGAVDLGSNPGTDVFPAAAFIWNKATDRFALALPADNQNILHRLAVHFFNEGYSEVKDSSAFKPAATLLDRMPGLAAKRLKVADNNRIIENLTHVQLESLLVNIKKINDTAKAVHELTSRADGQMRQVVDNAFGNPLPRRGGKPAPSAS